MVLRNRSMTNAFHTKPVKHHLRRAILKIAAAVPLPPIRKPEQERILLIRPDHLGDVLLTTPALHALRKAKPDAEIHLLVGAWSAEVLGNYDELDLVLTLPFPGFTRTAKGQWYSPYQLIVQSAYQMRRIGYTSAVILRPDHWWGAMLAKFAGIPERIGYDLPDTLPFLSHPVKFEPVHTVMQNLRLIEHWTGKIKAEESIFRFPVQDNDQAFVREYLEKHGVQLGEAILCIHPGSGTEVKQWQEASWARVADLLSEQLNARVIFTGSQNELPLTQRIVQHMKQPALIAAGDTRIGQLAALYQRARLVLGPDSGPLHLAVAVGTPTVALFGPADPAEFGSWGTTYKHAVLTAEIGCRPCRILDWSGDDPQFHPCVREISITQVLEAAHTVTRRD